VVPVRMTDSVHSVYFLDGAPQLMDSFVVYLDSLGTKERISNLRQDSLADERATVLRLDAILHKEEWVGRQQRFVTFTDNVILGAPADPFSTARQLRFLLTSIARYQLEMTLQSRPLRGGVCRGPLFMDDRLVTGEGLVEAVLLEEEEAIVPRVLLDADCYQSVKADGSKDNLQAGQGMDWDSLLLVDGDGRLFVNYLMAIPYVEVPAEVQSGLHRHAGVITAGLDSCRPHSVIHKKYAWMAEYHNFVQTTCFSEVEVRVEEGEKDRDRQRSFRPVTDRPRPHAVTELLDQ